MNALERTQPLSLEEAIAQLISLGEKDPLDITRKLATRYGGDWIADQLAANWEDIIAEIARQKLGNERRAAIVSIGDLARSKQPVRKRDLMLSVLYTPTGGYIAFGEATETDFAEAAAYRRKLADGLLRYADYYEAWQLLLAEQDVRQAKQVTGPLPQLPAPPQHLELGA